ncbi:MAG: apolipoprotein N-acyltransferase [Candidatus Acidiferrales bacterium]
MIVLTPLRRVRLLLALASGLILAFGFAPYHTPLVAWLAMAMLVFVSLDARPITAVLCGALHGVAFYSLSVYWVYVVMRQYGGLGPASSFGVLALMIAVLSGFTMAFTAAVAWISRRSIGRACVAAPLVWVACEFGRHHMPAIGFPWNLLGYAVSDNLGLVQVVTVTGIYGLSLLVAGYGALSALLLVERSKQAFGCWLAASAVVLPVVLVGGEFVPQPGLPQMQARLVQTSLPQGPYAADWMTQYAETLAELERLSVAGGGTASGGPRVADGGAALQAPDAPSGQASSAPTTGARVSLIVWPEVPAPLYLQDEGFATLARGIAARAQTPFLFGHIGWKREEDGQLHPYNSAALLGASGERLYSYDKIHLVPFGEYNPWPRLLWFAGALTQEVSQFRAGSEREIGQLDGGKFATLICYEAIFGNEVGQFVARGAELLVNISNDGWFGRTAAPDQHLAIARVRAVENRRWLLRATNNGYTAAVDPYGRIVVRMPADTRGALDVPFGFRSDRTVYSRAGDWVAWLSLAASVVVIWQIRRKEVRT